VHEHITTKLGSNDKVGVAYVYFNDMPESQQPFRVISTFIKQLCEKKKQIPQYLLDFHNTYDRDVRIPSFDAYKRNFFLLVKSFDQTFVIIDALDECKQDEERETLNRKQIMNFILELTHDQKDDPPCVKVFVTSRRETDIMNAFSLYHTPTIQIEAKNVTGDINTYINDHVEDLVKMRTLKLRRLSLKKKIVEMLIANAEGM
jgi:ankyrin repeat domain-containing protein 50